MFTESQTRITIATDILLTCTLTAHNDEDLTKEQRDLLNRIYEDLEALRKEVAPD